MSNTPALRESDTAITKQLENQHPLHGVLGRVYANLGGQSFIEEWAIENPGGFIKLLFGATPSMQPMTTIQGDVTLVVHPSLAPTALDAHEIDVTPK